MTGHDEHEDEYNENFVHALDALGSMDTPSFSARPLIQPGRSRMEGMGKVCTLAWGLMAAIRGFLADTRSSTNMRSVESGSVGR